jgi:thiol-disulfide isomerase/thioredoxin
MRIISNYRSFIGVLAVLLAGRAWASPVVVTVTASDTGQVIPGATIARLLGSMRTKTHNVLQTTPTVIGSTDAIGQFRLDCDPAERSAFLVTASGKTPRTFGFWGCVPATYQLTLSKATGTLSGRIVDGAGEPIANARVRVRLYDYKLLEAVRLFNFPFVSFTLDGRTDNSGRFTVPSAPLAAVAGVEVELWDNWRSAIAISEKSDNPAGVEDALRDGSFLGQVTPAALVEVQAVPRPTTVPSLTLHLRVLDAETNRPIANVRVSPGGAISPDQFFRTLSRSALDLAGNDVTWSFYDGAWAYFLRVEADGYAAAPTRIVKASEKHAELELKLPKATTITVAVRTPDGRPAAGAHAYLATPTMPLNVPLGPPRWTDVQPITVAGTDGMIHFSPPAEPYRLAILNSDGSAEVTPSTDKDNAVTMTPWASVSITVAAAGKPLAGAYVQPQSGFSEGLGCPINWGGYYRTDAAGCLTISTCRPRLLLNVAAPVGEARAGWSYLESQAHLKPGEHLDWSLMTGKTTVRANLMEYPGYRWSRLWIEPSGPAVNLPAGINQLPQKQREAAVSQAQKTAPDANAAESVIDDITVRPGEDGSIAVAGLRPGTYVLGGFAQRVDANDANTPSSRPEQPPSLYWYFTVPTSQPQTLDLGTVSPQASDALALQVGQIVPDLNATTLDGKLFSLRACRGRWVLLNFWGTWCGFCIADEPSLKDAYEGWSRDGRLAMVSASVDDTVEQVRRHVVEKQLLWTQIVLGPREHTNVPQKFGVDGYPTIMLVSPEGKLIKTGLGGGGLRDALLKHLGPALPPSPSSLPGTP